jgi:polysaccharide export outer membrane protein
MRSSILALVVVTVAACGPTTKPAAVEPIAPPQVDITLGVGDTFEVRVFGEPDLSGTFKVGGQGNITYPLVGDLHVEGLDPQAVSKLIGDRLRQGIMRDPQVTVTSKDQLSKKVYILGQVGHPGTFPYSPSMTVVEAITVAGGFTQLAAKNDTTITRIDQGKETKMKVPVADIGEGKARNVFLRPGDIISVPERLF